MNLTVVCFQKIKIKTFLAYWWWQMPILYRALEMLLILSANRSQIHSLGLQFASKLNIFNFPGLLIMANAHLIVMSPSQAEGFSARLGSVRDLFHFSSELKIDWKMSWNFNCQLKTYFLSFSIIKLTKLCIWIKLFTFKNTKIQINDHEID